MLLHSDNKAQKFVHSIFKNWSFRSIEIFNVFFKPMELNWSIFHINLHQYHLWTLFRGKKLKIFKEIIRISSSEFVVKSNHSWLRWALHLLSLLLNELSNRALLGLKKKIFSSANWKLFDFAFLIKGTTHFLCTKKSVAFFFESRSNNDAQR